MSQWTELLRSVGRAEPSPSIPARALGRLAQLGEQPAPRRSGKALRIVIAGAACCLVLAALALAAHSHEQKAKPTTPTKPLQEHPMRFVGLPPKGARPNSGRSGTLVMRIRLDPGGSASWNVYADGRIIWQTWNHSGEPLVIPTGASPVHTGYVQQRLTRQGVRLLHSKILATGLFQRDHSLADAFYERYITHSNGVGVVHGDDYQVVNRGRLIDVQVMPPSWYQAPRSETPSQARALARIVALLRDSTTRLPATAWADAAIRPYVPSHCLVTFDRHAPDPSKLPSPAGDALRRHQYLLRHACQIMTTDQARALLLAYRAAGIVPAENRLNDIHFAGAANLDVRPAFPDDTHC